MTDPARQFAAETDEHEMTVLHDEGLYRHLRFGRPGTELWSFSLITWPHHLAISGDVGGGWTFTAREDMIDFFGARRDTGVNLSYWWEKLPSAQRSAARSFSADRLLRLATDDIAGWGMAERDRAEAVERLLFVWEHEGGYEQAYRGILDDFVWTPTITNSEVISGFPIRFRDVDEWDAEDFDHHFQLACHAIAFGAHRYIETELE